VFDGVAASACSVPTQGYLPLSQAAAACNYIMTCDDTGQFMADIESSIGVVTSSTNFAFCMNAIAGAIPQTRPGNDTAGAALGCVAAAPSCAAARACMGIETIDPPTDPRCKRAPDSGVYCADAGIDIVDCTDAGGFIEHCNQPPFQGEGACVIDPKSPENYFCGDNGGNAAGCSQCDIATSLLTTCEQGTTLEGYTSCAALGQTCGQVAFVTADGGDAGTFPECLTNGVYDGCNANNYDDQCVDGAVSTCNFLGSVSPTDCTALGQQCVQGDQPYCSAQGAACTPYSPGIGNCQGQVLSLCMSGKPLSFDCRCAGMICQNSACVPP
jgi:hypothetical protein